MAAQVEIKFGRVCDGAVHCGASWNITTLPNLQGVIKSDLGNRLTNRYPLNAHIWVNC